jgi:hypothetical protein
VGRNRRKSSPKGIIMYDWIGWVASAIFASSYFCKQPGTLRRVQALAALVWMGYGVLIHAMPIIVANLVVAVMALYSSFAPRASVDRVNN